MAAIQVSQSRAGKPTVADDEDDDETPLERSPPRPAAPPAIQQAVAIQDYQPKANSQIPLRVGEVVEVVNSASAYWWQVQITNQDGSTRRGLASPKMLRVIPPGERTAAAAPAPTAPAAAPAAAPRQPAQKGSYMLMIVPNELVPLGKKFAIQASSLDEVVKHICATLKLQNACLCLNGSDKPITSIAELPPKAKVQMWPRSKFQAAAPPAVPAAAPAPASAVERKFLLMVAQSELVPLTKKITASGSNMAQIVECAKQVLGLDGDLGAPTDPPTCGRAIPPIDAHR